jgi:putative ABC transport system permease protein
MIGPLLRRLRLAVLRSREDRALDEEIQLHLDLLEAQARTRGVPPEQARADARRRFGHGVTHRESARDASGLAWLDDLRQDLRYGARAFVRERRFALTALLTLALGTGATTAIFSVVSGLILRPLPFPQPERLVQIHGRSALGEHEALFNPPAYREAATAIEAMAGYEVSARYLQDAQGAERVMTVRTEPTFFTVLQTTALRGRTYGAADPASLVVVSERFWRTRLGGDPSAIGSTIRLDGEAFTIAGVMPEAFQFPYGAASLLPGVAAQSRTDVWMPFARPVLGRVSNVVARLRPGAALAAAQGEFAAVSRRLQAADPARHNNRSAQVVPLAEAVVAPEIRRVLFLLFGAVGVVLALACANVINLFLGRMADRSREIAVRAALGARWFRLVRQLLAESLLLSLAGGALGLALAWFVTARLIVLAGPLLPRAADVSLDWRVFLFLFAICTLTGVITGLAPAVIAARRDGRTALQESAAQTTPSPAQRWLRDALVVFEVAAALVLAIGAATLGRELVRLHQTDSGLLTDGVVTFHVGHRPAVRGQDRPLAEEIRPFLEIESRVVQLPGVKAAGFTQLLPLQNWGWTSRARDFRISGAAPPEVDYPIQLRFVTPGYFQAHGVAVVQGRTFTAADDRDAPFALVINETLARRAFGGRSAIGAETSRGTIVGVVRDSRQVHLDRAAEPEIYYTLVQNWSQLSELGMTLVVSTHGRPEASIDAVRSIIREVGPQLAVFNVKTMDRVIADSLADFRLYLSLLGSFAALALILAVSGTYGVISYVAMTRVREVAIRMALGADRGAVVRMLLRRGVVLAAIGLAVGGFAAFLASPVLDAFSVAVRRPGLVTTIAVAAVLGLIAVAASAVPARRASRVDPVMALRND